jgi:hypothetical protein
VEKVIKTTETHKYTFSYAYIVDLLKGCIEGVPSTVQVVPNYKYDRDIYDGHTSKDFVGITLSWEELWKS